MKNWQKISIAILLIIAFFLLVRKCESEPKSNTVTEIVYRDRVDTIIETKIKEVPKKVYYEVIKTIKGKDSIVYIDKPSDNSFNASVYDVIIKTDSSSADLKITSLTRPIDVRGVIRCTEKLTNIKETIVKPKSGLFLYGESSINPIFENVGVGLDYQFRNSVILGTSVNFDNISKHTYFSVKFGIKIL